MRLTLRKDTSFDLPPARNARKWQLAKEEAARQGRGGDIREIINIYTLMALLPTYKSHAAVQKAAEDANATTRSGKPIAPAAAPTYAQARRIWRQDGMAGASRLAEAMERDYGHFSRQDHLDAADHHEQSQHAGSKADQACHRIASWSHQMAADADMQQSVQGTKKSLAEVAGPLRTYIKAMPATRTASRPILPLRKAGSPAYTSREMVNGSWRYHYAGDAHEGTGKTQSGKTVPHPSSGEYRNHMPGDTKFADYSQQDHADAHKLHAEAGKKLASEADDIQHAYATRHGNTSVRENSQQADASDAHFRSATAARTMAQAHVDAAVTHARLGGMAKSISSRPRNASHLDHTKKSQTRRKLTVKPLSKAGGHKYQSREMGAGGHWKYTYADGAGGKSGVIGKTSSGKPVHETGSEAMADYNPLMHGAKFTIAAHPEFGAQDHYDAAVIHSNAAKAADKKAGETHGIMPHHIDAMKKKALTHKTLSNAHAKAAQAIRSNSYEKSRKSGAGAAKSQTRRHSSMKKSMNDPLGDIAVESVYAPMGFARISDVDGNEIKTDAKSIDELAALIADMASYNAGTVVGGVTQAQRDTSTVPAAEEPPVVPQSTTIDASGNAPSDTPETEVVTKSASPFHVTLGAQWADSQSITLGMPTFLPPDALEGDARFALIGQ